MASEQQAEHDIELLRRRAWSVKTEHVCDSELKNVVVEARSLCALRKQIGAVGIGTKIYAKGALRNG